MEDYNSCREIVLSPSVRKRKHGADDDTIKKKKNCTKETTGFNGRCRPQRLCQLVDALTDAQKNDIKSIGFGGLLSLHQWTYVHWHNMIWFIQNFNPATRVLQFEHSRVIVVTPADIEDIFLLPRNEAKRVVVLGRNDESGRDYLKCFKMRFGFKDSVDLGCVFELLKDKQDVRLKDGGDDFKRLFVLFALSSFLTATQNSLIELSVIKSLIDVSQISTFDWCTFILEKLCKAVSSFKNKTHPKNLYGCPLVLPLLYFHRFMWLGSAAPCSLPLIQHWTSTTFFSRLKDELIGGSGFGVGKWIDDKYPISGQIVRTEVHKMPYEEVSGVPYEEVSVEDVHVVDIPHEEDEDDENSECINYKIPRGEKTNTEIKSIAKSGLHESYLLLKRDINVITHHHIKRLRTYKPNAKRQEGANTSSFSLHPSPVSTPTDATFSDDSQDPLSDIQFHKHIDEIVDKFLELKKLHCDDDIPNFNLLTPDSNTQNSEQHENDFGPCHEMSLNAEIDILLASIDRRNRAKKAKNIE